MRLLVITQKVDVNDPVLGFFHNWLRKLSSKFDSIVVICLGRGKFELPKNVEVLSLGKEKGENRFKYIWKFFNYSVYNLSKYDAVFVHMNQEYVLLGGLLWKMFGKKIYFWRNHVHGNLFTRIAVWFSDKIFYTSKSSFTARYSKAIQMPVGIDTDKFNVESRKSNVEIKNKILSLGRISPIKNVHVMVEAMRLLKERGVEASLDIVGNPANDEDSEYKKDLIEKNKDLIGEGIINFYPAVTNDKTPEIYHSHQIFINLTPSGSFDKTILEAAACGCIPVVANKSLESDLPSDLVVGSSPEEVALAVEKLLKYTKEALLSISKRVESYVTESHSLKSLVAKLTDIINVKQ